MTTMMHGLYLHFFLFCLYGGIYTFYSLSFFKYLFFILFNCSKFLIFFCFRCTGFNMIFYCSLVYYILGIIYVESTGRKLLVYEHVLGES